MNKHAAKIADDELYSRHPELIDNLTGKRRPLTDSKADEPYRSEWMMYYKAVDKADKKAFDKCEVDGVKIACPTVVIGEEGGQAISLPIKAIPAKPDAAPKAIVFSADICKQFGELWGKSFPNGKSKEFGGTLVKDKDGTVTLVNTGGGNKDFFLPNRNVASGQTIVGVFHTHPYDKSEGGDTNVSLSGGDAGYMINQGDDLIIAQSGDGQFVYLRTAQTPSHVDATKLDDAQNKRITKLMSKGKTFDEASRMAAKQTAKKYGMAYYEGKNCTVNRVSL